MPDNHPFNNSFKGEISRPFDDEASNNKSGNLDILEDAERSEGSFGREVSGEIRVKKKLGTGEEEEYFEFEDKRQDDGKSRENQNIDMRQSIDFFDRIKQINSNFKALDRLTRPPVFKWAVTSDQDKDPIGPDPFTTSQLRMLVVTYNLAGKSPSPEDLDHLLHP